MGVLADSQHLASAPGLSLRNLGVPDGVQIQLYWRQALAQAHVFQGEAGKPSVWPSWAASGWSGGLPGQASVLMSGCRGGHSGRTFA